MGTGRRVPSRLEGLELRNGRTIRVIYKRIAAAGQLRWHCRIALSCIRQHTHAALGFYNSFLIFFEEFTARGGGSFTFVHDAASVVVECDEFRSFLTHWHGHRWAKILTCIVRDASIFIVNGDALTVGRTGNGRGQRRATRFGLRLTEGRALATVRGTRVTGETRCDDPTTFARLFARILPQVLTWRGLLRLACFEAWRRVSLWPTSYRGTYAWPPFAIGSPFAVARLRQLVAKQGRLGEAFEFAFRWWCDRFVARRSSVTVTIRARISATFACWRCAIDSATTPIFDETTVGVLFTDVIA